MALERLDRPPLHPQPQRVKRSRSRQHFGRARIQCGYTQSEIAARAKISLRAYQNYESGTSYPEIPNLIKLADYFDVTTDYLLGRSEERK